MFVSVAMVSSMFVQKLFSCFSSSSRIFALLNTRYPPPKSVVDRPILTASSSYSLALVSIVKLFGLPFMVIVIMPGIFWSVRIRYIRVPFGRGLVFVFRPFCV